VLGFALVGTIVLVLAGGKDYSSGSGPTRTRRPGAGGAGSDAGWQANDC